MKLLRTIFTTLVLTAIVQSIYYYPRVPNIVASHFDGLGEPNGWSSKLMFFGIYAAVLFLTVFIFNIVPRMLVNSSGRGLKIPNKSYWLDPERQHETLQFYRFHFLLFGIANLLLVIFVIQLIIIANFKDQPRLDSAIVWALILYFIFVIIWLIRFYTRFRRKS